HKGIEYDGVETRLLDPEPYPYFCNGWWNIVACYGVIDGMDAPVPISCWVVCVEPGVVFSGACFRSGCSFAEIQANQGIVEKTPRRRNTGGILCIGKEDVFF